MSGVILDGCALNQDRGEKNELLCDSLSMLPYESSVTCFIII